MPIPHRSLSLAVSHTLLV